MPIDTRRSFLYASTAGVAVLGASRALLGAPASADAQIGPAEDLMREHGVLRRVMFLYDEAARCLESNQPLPLDALGAGAGIVKRVIEEYHEQLEEKFIFPRMAKDQKLAGLVATLDEQHKAGRKVTAEILRLSAAKLADADRAKLAAHLRVFNRMYRPHAAREDTLLFPAFHDALGDKNYMELGEQFEAEETKHLGDHGFEHAVAQVGKLEEQFGLGDLAQFTPR